MPKRKAAQIEDAEARPLRRSTRNSTSVVAAAPTELKPASVKVSKGRASEKPKGRGRKQSTFKPAPAAAEEEDEDVDEEATKEEQEEEVKPKPSAAKKKKTATKSKTKMAASSKPARATTTSASASSTGGGKQYWLLKAEPEPRYENGINVSFSIDDLAACTVPEPWDGIRNYVARNNLRSMSVGDLAFFYHSNCKTPGIVGVMEIVRPASPDQTAWDSKSAYYDPKDGPEVKRWSVVHVEFRRKFSEEARGRLGLQEMKKWMNSGKGEGPLRDMQLLKQGRLSVSKVSEGEWEFLMGLGEEVEGTGTGTGGK
ncbi:DUF55-domain-containing protein [Zalerion maritima]|uniref:Thymocyte nuclear protein 1 n=1 Tax=Zalerion maritima TaxID=339359 RepID=A0AAD5RJI9_9PEZI|nr:DUF55-domain-containing protein [Zalerion maritima]